MKRLEKHPVVVSHKKAAQFLSRKGYKRGTFDVLPNGDIFAILDANNAYNYTTFKLLRYEDVNNQFNAKEFMLFITNTLKHIYFA